MEVRDLIYLDFDKAASISSQLSGGLREKLEVTEDDGKAQKAGVKFGIPTVAEANLGVDYATKQSAVQTRILHHDVLNHVENGLQDLGFVVDLMTNVAPDESDPQSIRNAIGLNPYVKASGNSVIEDYQKILSTSQRFNDIAEFLSKCGTNALKESPEYIEMQEQLDVLRGEIKSTKNGQEKAAKRKQLKVAESALKGLTSSQVEKLEKWLLDGIKLWIQTFMANRINFRVYPFPQCPSFQVICNLKRDCFVDSDLEHLLYGYGTRPNVPLSVFGLLTSIPLEDSADQFDPLAEFDSELLTDHQKFEGAFRKMFQAMDDLDAFMRYSRYPNVTVHPIAVYRSFASA